MIRNLFWTVSLFSLLPASTSFVAPSIPVTTVKSSDELRPMINPSIISSITSTTISASASVSSSSIELNQRALLETRLKVDSKYRELQKQKTAEQARLRLITNEINQRALFEL